MRLAFKYQLLLARQDKKLLKFIRDKIKIFLEENPTYRITNSVLEIDRLLISIQWFHCHFSYYKYNYTYDSRLLTGFTALILYKENPTVSLPNIKFFEQTIYACLGSSPQYLFKTFLNENCY